MRLHKRLAQATVMLAACGISTAYGQQVVDNIMLPPNPVPGECYARVFVPPNYEEFTETVLVREASKKLTANKPSYEWVDQTVVVEDAYTKVEVIPARFEWVEEKVMVKEASEELLLREAKYRDVEEQIMVQPAYTTWKKGRGLIEKIDEATGEIMCLVEVPAEYKTITKRVIDRPAGIEKVTIPAEFKTIKKKVMVEPPRTETVEVPAKYKTMRVQKVVDVARANEIDIPAKYATVSKIKKVADGHLEWRSVLCETNARPTLITDIQRALLSKGFAPGPIDGVMGEQTMAAAHAFQQANGLASGSLTMETLRTLGVSVR